MYLFPVELLINVSELFRGFPMGIGARLLSSSGEVEYAMVPWFRLPQRVYPQTIAYCASTFTAPPKPIDMYFSMSTHPSIVFFLPYHFYSHCCIVLHVYRHDSKKISISRSQICGRHPSKEAKRLKLRVLIGIEGRAFCSTSIGIIWFFALAPTVTNLRDSL